MISTLTSLSSVSLCLWKDECDDLQEEHAICKTRKRVDFAVAVGKARVWAPLAHDCGCKAHCETSAVEKHVNTVCEQSQRPADETIEELDHHKSQVKSV